MNTNETKSFDTENEGILPENNENITPESNNENSVVEEISDCQTNNEVISNEDANVDNTDFTTEVEEDLEISIEKPIEQDTDDDDLETSEDIDEEDYDEEVEEEEILPRPKKPKASFKDTMRAFLNKRNIILFCVLVALLLLWQLSKSKENVERKIEVFKINSSDILRIEFIQPADTLIIAFEDNRWRITHPQDAPVNQDQLDRFFENYLALTHSSNFISESIERQAFFNVDEDNALQIVLFGRNNRPLSRIFYGRNFTDQRIAYIRQEHSNQIYRIDNIYYFINPTFSAWEGEEVIDFNFDEWDMGNEIIDTSIPTIMIGE